jgi:hypothetical protein
MCRFRRGPEIRDREARVEVCAEIVHPGDGEHDVHAELIFGLGGGGLVGGKGEGREGRGRGPTLKTSRLGPPMVG